MTRPLHWYDYITVNIYFLGLTLLSQTLTALVVPLMVQRFVGESVKGTFYGTLRLWTLMAALLAQSLMGMLSDRSTLPLGRRRPFILIGTLGNLVIIAAIGFSAGLTGMTGYWVLFALVVLLAISSNTAQAAQQGLIPDLIPDERRGRFSAVKAIFELPLPLIMVSFTVARLVTAGNTWGGILVAAGVLVASALLAMLVPERPLREIPGRLDWKPFARLLSMTGLFTVVILGTGEVVKLAGRKLDGNATPIVIASVMGLMGLLAMVIAIALGVWASIRVSLGSRDARQNRSFTWWVINRLAFLVGAGNLGSFAVYFIQARLGLERERAAQPASLLMMVVGICILASALPSGWLADRFGRKRMVSFSGILAGLATLVAIFSPGLAGIYAGGCALGAATGLFFTANWALGTELVPKAEAGRYLGIANLAGAGAGAVGAYIGGPIADFVTLRVPAVPGMGYLLIFAIYGALFFLSVLALAQVHEPQRLEVSAGAEVVTAPAE